MSDGTHTLHRHDTARAFPDGAASVPASGRYGAASGASSATTSGHHDGQAVLVAGPASALGTALVEAFTVSGSRAVLETQLWQARAPRPDERGLIEAALATLGGLDAVVRYSPALPSGQLLDASAAAWRDAVLSGLFDAFELSRAAARAMTRGGAIVHLASVDALHAYAGRSAAATVMAGLVGLARALAVELAPQGVRANVVIAGPIAEVASAHDGDTRMERTLLRSPARRLGSAAEVARAVVWVAGPRAAFMTGQTLRVDGGWASLNQAPDGMKFE